MKFNHLRGDGASKFLYIIDAQSVNEDTQVLAGHLLIKELRSRNRFQPSNILSAGDATQSLSVCKYAGVSHQSVFQRIRAKMNSTMTSSYTAELPDLQFGSAGR